MFRLTMALPIAVILVACASADRPARSADRETTVPILVYHRFGPVVADSMTVTTAAFSSQLKFLKDNGYTVIPLKQLLEYFQKGSSPPPSRSVVITVDDGHRSVYTEMLPLVRQFRIPVTLFIYPSAISNATYALTWSQLREMQATGLFEVESHTYWHPNFKIEKKRLSPSEYDQFVQMQLTKSKERLEKELGITVGLLAWPFGIHDQELIQQALGAGYTAAFTLQRRAACRSDNPMALPRYLMTNGDIGQKFERILSGR